VELELQQSQRNFFGPKDCGELVVAQHLFQLVFEQVQDVQVNGREGTLSRQPFQAKIVMGRGNDFFQAYENFS